MDVRWMRLAWIVLATLAWALPVGCGDDGGSDPDPDPNPEVPFFDSDYKATYVEALECRPFSIGHESNTVSIHIDPISAQQYLDQAFEDPLPEGTVIVKTEHLNAQTCEDVIRITAMRKGPDGTAPNSGNWEWQELDSAGNVLESGQIADCISCHTDDPCPPLDFTCWDGSQDKILPHPRGGE